MLTRTLNEQLAWARVAVEELEGYLDDPTADAEELPYAELELVKARRELAVLEATAGGRAR